MSWPQDARQAWEEDARRVAELCHERLGRPAAAVYQDSMGNRRIVAFDTADPDNGVAVVARVEDGALVIERVVEKLRRVTPETIMADDLAATERELRLRGEAWVVIDDPGRWTTPERTEDPVVGRWDRAEVPSDQLQLVSELHERLFRREGRGRGASRTPDVRDDKPTYDDEE